MGLQKYWKGFTGILQTDGYKVYEVLYKNHPTIILVYCMAHARRKFVEAQSYDKEKANEVLSMMQLLYKLEKEMRDEGLSWEQRTERRQQEAVPILEQIEIWLKENASQVLPKKSIRASHHLHIVKMERLERLRATWSN